MKNIIPVNLVAYSKNTKIHFYNVYGSSGLSGIYNKYYKYRKYKRITIQAKKLDDILKGFGIKKVDLIKLDVERSEADVLKGSRRILKNSKNLKIVFEALDSYHLNKCKKILNEFGFKIDKIDYDMYMAHK